MQSGASGLPTRAPRGRAHVAAAGFSSRRRRLRLLLPLVPSGLQRPRGPPVPQHHGEGPHPALAGSAGAVGRPATPRRLGVRPEARRPLTEGTLASAFFQDSAADCSLPVKAMSTSLPLWSILVFYFTNYWFFCVKLVYMPTYLSSVLQLSLTNVSTQKAHPVPSAQTLVSRTVTGSGAWPGPSVREARAGSLERGLLPVWPLLTGVV